MLSVVFAVSVQLIIGCLACSSACATCSKSASNCTSCTNQLDSGKCVATCPDGTFSRSKICVKCHTDCASCSGSAYNQCKKCPENRPVLSDGGRCLPTCSRKNQFFNFSTSSCEECDLSCSSCFGAGSNNCLACSNPGEFLQNGTCSLPPLLHFVYLLLPWLNHPANAGPVIKYSQ